MAHIRGLGWEGVGGGGGGKPKAVKATIKRQTAVVCVQKWHKQPQSTGQAETVVGYSLAPHTSLLMPFSGSTGLVVHVYGLTGSRKALCESRLGYLYPCIWCAWTVRECSFNVKP